MIDCCTDFHNLLLFQQRIESDRDKAVYIPGSTDEFGPLLTAESSKAFISLLYLLSPVQPQRIVHKLILNLCHCESSRTFLLHVLVGLLNNDKGLVLKLLSNLDDSEGSADKSDLGFPPLQLIGVPPVPDRATNSRQNIGMFRRRQVSNTAVTVAASLPASSRGSSHSDGSIPPVVARRVISLFSSLCKSSPRVAYSMLSNKAEDIEEECTSNDPSCLEKLLDLLEMRTYSESATNLEQLLSLLEIVVAPMSLLPKDNQDVDLSADRNSPGREWVKVPRVVVSKRRLHSLVNTLRLESCKDSSFLKINTLTRRLSRVEANRITVLDELALVAEGLGRAAILDMKAVNVRLSIAAKHHREKRDGDQVLQVSNPALDDDFVAGTPSSAVSLSTSNSELKLLRVLQMLNALCAQDDEAKSEGILPEFDSLLKSLNLEALWDQLNSCLKTVSVLEGVANIEVDENDVDGDGDEDTDADGGPEKKKTKLQNSVAGLISRFLPAIEAFFMINASPPPSEESTTPGTDELASSSDNSRLAQFAASNKILLNALLRSNPSLLEKGLKAMVKMPYTLDFDVKRAWFKSKFHGVFIV